MLTLEHTPTFLNYDDKAGYRAKDIPPYLYAIFHTAKIDKCVLCVKQKFYSTYDLLNNKEILLIIRSFETTVTECWLDGSEGRNGLTVAFQQAKLRNEKMKIQRFILRKFCKIRNNMIDTTCE